MNFSVLFDICSYPRFARTESEVYILNKHFFKKFGGYYDEYGNWWYCTDSESSTLFTAHSDTVHKKTAQERYYLEQTSDGKSKFLHRKGDGVLGADCGTGMFIIHEMITNNVPGTYVIYRDEEIGGRGSYWSAENEAVKYAHFSKCISFDRRGYTDVITHQSGTRCCSDEFAIALSDQLGLNFCPSPDGLFTDSLNLTHLIQECTNISVGYFGEHSLKEFQDLTFLEELIASLCKVDFDSLPVVGTGESDNELEYMCAAYPKLAADLLARCGYTVDDFNEAIFSSF